MSDYDFILASASPRRRELLEQMGCQFEVITADIDESVLDNEQPSDYVTRLAAAKARTVFKQCQNQVNSAVLAADTIVCLDDIVFGKPENQQHAIDSWQTLSGKTHQVITAISLITESFQNTEMVATDVEFVDIDQQQMRRYWQTGEPNDKAGGYAIQGLASAWVKQIHGSYSNVVGLPLRETNQLLSRVGHNWL